MFGEKRVIICSYKLNLFVMGSCEQSNESSGSTKDQECLEQLSDCRIVKDCPTWNELLHKIFEYCSISCHPTSDICTIAYLIWFEFWNNTCGVALIGIIFIQSFMKICQLVQKLTGTDKWIMIKSYANFSL